MSVKSAVSRSTSGSLFSRNSVDSKSTSGRSTLHWKRFRKDVLARHHIRILDTIAGETLPESILTWIEANRTNTARFKKQRQDFRRQVANGRGFGSSALFPQEVLPSADGQPFLARCMVPTLSHDALPESLMGKDGSAIQKSTLSLPQPGLGCGFSASAFAPQEIKNMPTHLQATGTTIHFDTGSISSGSALYCPFMTFERALSQQEYGLEIAANQCAVNGAWSVRALQMLFARASGDDTDDNFQSPVAFSCAIDNEFAVINFHWVDHAQTYCMSPVVKFHLDRDDHFDQFLVWTEAIGQWALAILLPEIKKAISLLNEYVATLPPLVTSLKQLEPLKVQESNGLVDALKTTYDTIPWRYEDDEFSPVSSSTASWGSPMINEAVFAKFEYPIVQQPRMPAPARSVCSEPNPGRTIYLDVDLNQPKALTKVSKPTAPTKPAMAKKKPMTTGAFTQNTDLVMTRRLGHAMDEISELQTQIAHLKQEMSGSTTCLQNELSGLRKTMTSVIRKESTNMKQRSPLRTRVADNIFLQSQQRVQQDTIVTTPIDPRPQTSIWPLPTPVTRKSSGLQRVLTLDTSDETISNSGSVENSPLIPTPVEKIEKAMKPSFEDMQSPITIFSPTVINMHNHTTQTRNKYFTTSYTANNHVKHEYAEDVSNLVRVVSHQNSLWSQVAATHILSALVPSTILRVILLGCLLDYCMMTMSGNYHPSLSQYLSHVLENPSY